MENVLNVILIHWLFTLSLSNAQNCNFYQELIQGNVYYISSPGYPVDYKAGTSCFWDLRTPVGSKIYLSCNINIPESTYCNGDRLAVSLTGRKDFADGKRYCGKASLSFLSQGTSMTVGLSTTSVSSGGNVYCSVTSIEDPDYKSSLQSTNTYGCDCGWRRTTRIVGGQETGINEFPSMAAILYQNKLFCGTNIISDRYLLTAGHCVYQKVFSDLLVLVGDHDLTTGLDTKYSAIYRVNAFEIHPSYNPQTLINDVAIVQTATSIVFSPYVGPICLPFRFTNQYFYGQSVTILGWGTTEFSQSSTLQKAQVDVISNPQCAASYNEPIPYSEICTFTNGKDSCQFDSGGPLLWTDTNTGRLHLIGIISHGRACDAGAPGVNVRVTEYLQWILNRTGSTTGYCIK